MFSYPTQEICDQFHIKMEAKKDFHFFYLYDRISKG